MGVEPARQRRQERSDDEGHELDAERIDAEALGHDAAGAQRAHRAALARVEQVGGQQQGDDQEQPDQVVDAGAVAERVRADGDRRHVGNAAELPEHGQVAEQEIGREPPGDGAERQEMAAQPQGHGAEDRRDQAGEQQSRQQTEPRRIAQERGEPGRGVGGDADEGGLAEGQHAADAGQQHQAQHREGVDADVVHQRDAEGAQHAGRHRDQQNRGHAGEAELQRRHSSASSSSLATRLSERQSRTGMSRPKPSTVATPSSSRSTRT